MPSGDFLCLVCVAVDCIVVLEQKHLCRVVSFSSGPLELEGGGGIPSPVIETKHSSKDPGVLLAPPEDTIKKYLNHTYLICSVLLPAITKYKNNNCS